MENLLLVIPVGFDPRFNVTQKSYNLQIGKKKIKFQKQQNPIEIFSGVYGGFKIAKPSKFSNVQKKIEMMVNDNGNQFSNIPDNIPVKKMLFVISYLDGTIFNWVQPRLDFFFGKRWQKTKAKYGINVLQIQQFSHLYKKGFQKSK